MIGESKKKEKNDSIDHMPQIGECQIIGRSMAEVLYRNGVAKRVVK